MLLKAKPNARVAIHCTPPANACGYYRVLFVFPFLSCSRAWERYFLTLSFRKQLCCALLALLGESYVFEYRNGDQMNSCMKYKAMGQQYHYMRYCSPLEQLKNRPDSTVPLSAVILIIIAQDRGCILRWTAFDITAVKLKGGEEVQEVVVKFRDVQDFTDSVWEYYATFSTATKSINSTSGDTDDTDTIQQDALIAPEWSSVLELPFFSVSFTICW